MSDPRAKRHQYRIQWDPRAKVWVCRVGGAAVFGTALWRRSDIIGQAASFLSLYADVFGQHSELIVTTKRGTISERRTYPRSSDPRRHRG